MDLSTRWEVALCASRGGDAEMGLKRLKGSQPLTKQYTYAHVYKVYILLKTIISSRSDTLVHAIKH